MTNSLPKADGRGKWEGRVSPKPWEDRTVGDWPGGWWEKKVGGVHWGGWSGRTGLWEEWEGAKAHLTQIRP